MPKIFSPKKIENRNKVGQQQQQQQQPHFWKRRGMRGKGGHPAAVRHQQPHHQQQKPTGVGAVQQQQQQHHPVGGRPTHQPTAAGTPPQQPLQQAEFPKCASDVLSKISEFVRQRGAQSNLNKVWNRAKHKELQMHIDAELFCLYTEHSRRGHCRLNQLQRLRLLGIICTYFSKEVAKESDPALRYLHFEIIFCGREGEAHLHDARVQFLVKLCSLATQYPVYGLFDHVAHWISKVKSDDLKRIYMEQIVAELVEGFVMASEEQKLHEFLLPLALHSFDFCANFVVFAISADSMGPALAAVVGEWLMDQMDQFIRLLHQWPHLGILFCAQKFNLLLRYDSTNSSTDDAHHRLHFMLLQFAAQWGQQQSTANSQKQHQGRISSSQQSNVNNSPLPLALSCLKEIFASEIDALSSIAQQRLGENILQCHRNGILPSLEPFRIDTSKLSEADALWQKLAAAIRKEQEQKQMISRMEE